MVPISQVAHELFLEVSEQHLRLLPCARLTPTNCRLRCRAPHHLFRYAYPPLLLGIFDLLFFLSLLLLVIRILLGLFIPANNTTLLMAGQLPPRRREVEGEQGSQVIFEGHLGEIEYH